MTARFARRQEPAGLPTAMTHEEDMGQTDEHQNDLQNP